MKKHLIIAMIAALAAPLAAHAENSYIGASVGSAKQEINVEGYGFNETATAFKLYGGYKLDQHFGVEAGLADLGKAEKSGNGASVSSEPTSLYLAVTATLPLNEQFSLIGKAGAVRPHVKLTASAFGSTDSGSGNSTSAYASVGAAYVLNPKVSFVAEYEYFDKIAKADGDDNSNIKASMLSVGVRYAF